MDRIDGITKPLVSVLMITYNHEAYIKEAIEGTISQKTNFPIEIVIADDASKDSTPKIIENFANKYPNIIKPILRTKNLGPNTNWLDAYSKCSGKYIALCEGDDYWIDEYKLQKQVDFLEHQRNYIFTFHDTLILNENTNQKNLRIGDRKIDEIVDLKSLIIENNIATASIVFKNVLDPSTFPKWFESISKGDYALLILLAEKGAGILIPGVMSVYRVHGEGVWSGKQYAYHVKEAEKFYKHLIFYLPLEFHKTIKLKAKVTNFNFGLNQLRKGKFINAIPLILFNYIFNKDSRLKSPIRKVPRAFVDGIKYFVKKL